MDKGKTYPKRGAAKSLQTIPETNNKLPHHQSPTNMDKGKKYPKRRAAKCFLPSFCLLGGALFTIQYQVLSQIFNGTSPSDPPSQPEETELLILPEKLSLKEYIDFYEQEMGVNSTSKIKPNLTIWQTWYSHTFPTNLENYWQNIMKSNPEYSRRVLNDTKAEEFVLEHCHKSFYDVYKSVNPTLKAMKADLWRYCVLYTYGGVYADADSGIDSKRPLKDWVNRNAVISQGGNKFSLNNCGDIWKAANENITYPDQIMVPNSLVQWGLIFPLPKHPILREAIDISTKLITAWKDSETHWKWSTHQKIVCLSGPNVFSVAANNAYISSGNSWDKLMVTMDGGIDFDGKLLYKSQFSGALYTKQKHYNHIDKKIPIKVA